MFKKPQKEPLENSSKVPSFSVNAASNVIALVIHLSFGFFLTPFMIENLGLARYGLWTLIVSIIGYYGLLDLGIASAVLRYVALHVGQKRYDSLNQVLSTSIFMFLIFGIIIICLTIYCSDEICSFFNIKNEDYKAFTISIYLFAFSVGIELPAKMYQIAIIAHEHFLTRNIISIFITIIRSVAIVLVLSHGLGLIALSLVNLILTILTSFLYYITIVWYFPHIKISIQNVRKSIVKTLFSFGFFSSICQLSVLLKTKIDSAVIGRYMTMGDIAIYGIAVLISGYVLNLIIAFSGVMQPRLASLIGKGNREMFVKKIIQLTNTISILSMGSGLVAFFLTRDFLELWLPSNFKEIDDVVLITYILLSTVVLDMINDVFVNALRADNKHKYFAYQSILEGIVNVFLSIYLVQKIGIIGVAYGTLIPTIITKAIIQPLFCCKLFKIPYTKMLFDMLIKPLVIVTGLIYVFQYLLVLPTSNNYIILIVKGVSIFFIYSIISFFLCLNKENKDFVIEKFRIKKIIKFLWNNK